MVDHNLWMENRNGWRMLSVIRRRWWIWRRRGFKDAGVQERIDVGPTATGFVFLRSIPTRPSYNVLRSLIVFLNPFSTSTHFPPHQPQTYAPTLHLHNTFSLASLKIGTSQFKLGEYGPPSESTTSAITLLPPGHYRLFYIRIGHWHLLDFDVEGMVCWCPEDAAGFEEHLCCWLKHWP